MPFPACSLIGNIKNSNLYMNENIWRKVAQYQKREDTLNSLTSVQKCLKKLISPIPRGGRQISSSAFLSRRPFGYYLPTASYDTILQPSGQAMGDFKLWFQSDLLKVKGLTAHRCSFYFAFRRQMRYATDHTTKLGMKDLLKDQQWWVERDSNLIPPQYRPNDLTTTPCSPP